MANSRSSRKRIKTNKRNSIRNSSYNSLIKTFTKKYVIFVKSYYKERTNDNYLLAKNSLNLIFSQIDKAAKKNVIQKNTASRKKSKLYKMLKESSNNKNLH
uniref:30S ribosomal protein S20 n=1 Tax=Phaeostrophion irregulare TaxID=243268 RepID=UPI002E76DE1A|nr:30S ribosomal protein S20 [Phaeostrophion irregulare]WAM64348.1 30S ribosomal protein S20 [Phaeostrophion irregulare]